MATTLMPNDPATSPQHVSRLLTISARLLPEEIVAARRARRTRNWVLVILVLVVALLAGWYLRAVDEKNDADEELQVLAIQVTDLQRSLNKDYADVVDVRSQTTTLDKQLKTVMADDLPWAVLLDTLIRAAAAEDVQLTGISGSLTPDAAAATSGTGTALPSTSGATTIGTLTLTGTAPDKRSVAAFVVRLGTLRTLANPYLTSATEADNGVQYSLQVDITDASRCGRFTTACKKWSK